MNDEMKRFDIFLIDTGWNAAVSKLVRSPLAAVIPISNSRRASTCLHREQSVEILKRHPSTLVATRPSSSTTLCAPVGRKHRNYHGFRLSLGRFKHPEQALSRLQEFLRFLISHRSSAALDTEVQRELHREGAQGMIKILREATTELL